ncbi:MAG: helix-turn-helix domain-containing protein [Raineya sp.]|nr:helix-turn-helix domain-containing protein [Raineya sp.]
MNLYERINKLKTERNIRTAQIAKHLNMEQSNYTRLEKRGERMSLEQISQIADALGVSVQYLLFGEKQPQDTNEKDRKIKELEKDLEILKMKIERQNILLEIYASLFEKIDDKERKKAFEELPKESKAAILILLGTEFIDWLINREKK